jgi:hypothetical protein
MNASLSVYDVQGRLIEQLVNGFHHAGDHASTVRGLDSGIYFVVLETKGETKVQKIVCLK